MFWKFLKPSVKTSATASDERFIEEQTPPIEFLQKLIPIGELPVNELEGIKSTIRSFTPGQIIFSRREHAESLVYLYSGNIFLEAADGNGYTVDDGTFQAYCPLSNHTEHHFSAIAKSNTKILYLPLSILQHCRKSPFINNPLINSADIPSELANSKFFNGFCTAFQRDEIQVPSLPDVAIRLRRALQQEVTNITDATKIINMDPAIASKLIQVANSPLYRSINTISNTHDAINRLGFRGTQNIVTSISLHNLFRTDNKLLNRKLQQIWKQSINIASLSYTLAGLTHTINPDEALLAGLTYNIGALPIITYAEKLKASEYTEQELVQTIATSKNLVGAFILKNWHFPKHLQQIPSQASYWYHDEDSTLQTCDIVLLARFHAQIGNSHNQKLPPLHTLPAFLKLGINTLTPDMSLQALQDAKHKINEAVNFLRM
ncbi:HDOD domain-containing protein [Methylomonas sp. MgM2]